MASNWNRFKSLYWWNQDLGVGLDASKTGLDDAYLVSQQAMVAKAMAAMAELERGAIANPDERRMVGHYWLRNPGLAPGAELRTVIEETAAKVKQFAREVHQGKVTAPEGGGFHDVVLIGIGGSALGPQMLHDALGRNDASLRMHFVDNTDPDGIARVFASIPDLQKTLCVVISKSGGTKETRNGQLLAQRALTEAGVPYPRACVAVTGEGSALDKTAVEEAWLDRFPMWDWVGGRTSLWSAVGLLPAALEGFDIDALLAGAAAMDKATRQADLRNNPAALLALAWYYEGKGRGEKAMVVLPYKDRLLFLSRYLQQLVMESLGKEKDLAGQTVQQGLTVYGNKGSTDQHAYVQQLRDGMNNFFAVFVEVLEDLAASRPAGGLAQKLAGLEVEPGVTSGDYLQGFLLGTRSALFEKGRESLTISLTRLDEFRIGALLALFERAVGLYASYVNINAYHQPGVEAGKVAAGEVLKLQTRALGVLSASERALTVEEIGAALKEEESLETLFYVLRHLAANGRIAAVDAEDPFKARYRLS